MRSKAPSTSTAAHKYNRFQVLLQVSLCRSRGTKIEVKRPESTTGGSVCFCMNYCTVVVLLYRLNSANKTGPPYSLPRLCKLIFPPTLTLTFHQTALSLLSNSYLRKRISKPSRLQLLPFTLAMEKRCLSLIENKKVGHVPSSQLNGKYIDNGSRANSA